MEDLLKKIEKMESDNKALHTELSSYKAMYEQLLERTKKDDDKPAGSHHGDPELTKRDIQLLSNYNFWIVTMTNDINRKNENYPGYKKIYPYLPGYPDWIKSRLFWRIRSGKKPLPYPPPTCFSCPWYEVIETEGKHAVALDIWKITEYDSKKIVNCATSTFDYLGEQDGKFLLGFGPYRFLAWNDLVDMTAIHQDNPVGKRAGAWIEFLGIDNNGAIEPLPKGE